MKNDTKITLADVKAAAHLTMATLCKRIGNVSQGSTSNVCALAKKMQLTPKHLLKTMQKQFYEGCKVYGMQAYDAGRTAWKRASKVLHIAPVHKARGKTATKNPKTIAKIAKAATVANKKRFVEVRKTKSGNVQMLGEVLTIIRKSKALDPIELATVSACFIKVERKLSGKAVKGKTTKTATGLIHTSD